MFADPELENVLQSLSFEARGEASNTSRPAVLSCGGIIFPRPDLPLDPQGWRQVVNLPHAEVSARIFVHNEPDKRDDLRWFLFKETLN
ncbi:MAG: hypothetical protein HYY44_06600 [Deltaproteobacteria bacterium]|nr:hypothetical protein [Deltaproteobacteria bacterium]MBI4373638.1 hypothetical protein [Deltaproteobacteria bacterium]